MEQSKSRAHFLVVTFPFQGHINPALHLARRLALTAGGGHVTFSTTVSAHRLMFPSGELEIQDGMLTHIPFSDGHDDGSDGGVLGTNQYMSDFKQIGSQSLSHVVGNLASVGRPVSCIIYTLLLSWAADVARDHGISSALYWIQPASVFSIYYHYFHGFESLVESNRQNPSFIVELPGLEPQKIQDLPSFLTQSSEETDQLHSVFLALRELFQSLDRERTEKPKPTVLINTFHELETGVLAALSDIEMLPIGPLLPMNVNQNGETGHSCDLFRQDEKKYIEWLDTKPEKSVVYVSFGSLSRAKKAQLEELLNGLEESGRPYLWVARRDNREEGVDLESSKNGMIVEWCDQVRVLSHSSIGCFVTHCGWNSVLESLAKGVLMVGAPGISDQGMNARLVEREWGVGVRAEINGEGVLERKEMKRCLELVMGNGERAMEMREKAEVWRDKAEQAIGKGGSSDRNLTVFVERINGRNGFENGLR